eukprot:513127-Hanusia_phi.AAC.1
MLMLFSSSAARSPAWSASPNLRIAQVIIGRRGSLSGRAGRAGRAGRRAPAVQRPGGVRIMGWRHCDRVGGTVTTDSVIPAFKN